jgi:hypothetical protein
VREASPPSPLTPVMENRNQEKDNTKGKPKPEPRPFYNLLPQWCAPLPDDKPPTEEENEQAMGELYSLWWEKTGFSFLDSTDNSLSDGNAAIRMIRTYGFDEVYDMLQDTFRCPKTAGITWTDFSFWCEKYMLTKKTITAWRNKEEAKNAMEMNRATSKGWR